MAVEMHPHPRRRCRRLPPAVATDLPVLVVMLACWVSVPVTWAHLTTALGLIALVGAHLATRRRLPARVLRQPRSGGQLATLASAWTLLAAMAAVTVTGLLRWAGLPREAAWHGATGYLLLTAAVVHMWLIRGRLRARTSPRGSTR